MGIDDEGTADDVAVPAGELEPTVSKSGYAGGAKLDSLPNAWHGRSRIGRKDK
jgi:hypothetical protein